MRTNEHPEEPNRVRRTVVAISVLMAVVLVLSFAASPVAAANPTVTTVAASGIGDFSATLNGDLTAMGAGNTWVKVGFHYGTDSALAGATNTTVGNKSATGTFLKSVFGLAPATKYFFRAWARNDTGNPSPGPGWATGSILNFTTTDAVGAAAASLTALLPTLLNLVVIILLFSVVIGVVTGLFGKMERVMGKTRK